MGATVILVHGLWMTGAEMTLLGWRLRRCGFGTVRFRYFSLRRGLAENAGRLARFANGVPGETVHFVAHSLGGLVVREVVRRFPDRRPGRIVTLGTPHHPSAVAKHLRGERFGRLLLGRSDSALTEEMPAWDGARDLGVIAGDMGVGVGRFFEAMREPNDGTVRVSETRLEGAADHIVLHSTHMGLLFSAAAARHACRFLKTGRFDHDRL